MTPDRKERQVISDVHKKAFEAGVYYRDGGYGERHSIHGLFPDFDPEAPNRAEHAMVDYGMVITYQDRKLHTAPPCCEVTFPPAFGHSALFTNNGIPVHGNREQAIEAFQQKYRHVSREGDAPGSGKAPRR